MTVVKFYEETADERLDFAVIISKTQNQYVFASTETGRPGKYPEATGSLGKPFWMPRNGNCMRKQALWNLT